MQTSLAEQFDLGIDQAFYLGHAKVVSALPNKVQVSLQDHNEWAQLAVGYPYQPCKGDSVLVIAQDSRCYVIGVLSGTGETVLSVPADLKLKAPRGSIELIAAKGIQLRSHDVIISSATLQVIAHSIRETFDHVFRRVKETYELCAGSVRTTVDGDYRVQADRIHQRAKNDVKLDGKKIHLG